MGHKILLAEYKPTVAQLKKLAVAFHRRPSHFIA